MWTNKQRLVCQKEQIQPSQVITQADNPRLALTLEI